ncbi:aminopeptidase P family N-terminal domain-containing protein [Mycobacterium sp. URHD0025]|uniref:aminopeptidase P family N-terminal domain-containing protein n=1 Tax=Mycobacterium sp. URHD0025 TaxID=1298864 RepID=UPI00048BB5CF|nr:aminopeptidase P family N-terminal domain-containing protein [Mycobacterium sp. URHD0025]
MLHLTADPKLLLDEFNLDPQRSLLFSAIRLDSNPLVSPLVATRGDDRLLLVRQQEQGNVLSAGVPAQRIRFYAPWVTIDPRPVADVPVAESLTELVAELARTEQVRLAHDVVYSHFLTLAPSVDVTIERRGPQPVRIHQVRIDDVAARFAKWRAHGAEVAAQLVSGIAHLDGIETEFGAPDTRFRRLASIAAERSIGTCLIAAPPNFTEVTGMPCLPGALALWRPESDTVLIFTINDGDGDTAEQVYGPIVGESASLADAITTGATDRRVGIEEEWVSVGLAQELIDAGIELIPVSGELAHWRDVRDNEDLPFQLIAARTSVYAIEEALDWADRQITAGIKLTELDIFDRYLGHVDQFRRENNIPFDVDPYFTNLHSSNRMLFPGPPVDFPIDQSTTCIQLDAGVRVSIDGVTLATSDMARSLPRTPEAKEAYGFFFTVVRDGIIGQLRPGVICENVHEGTMRFLEPHLPRMIEIGMLGDDIDFTTIYRRRNVGHLMGKQESFANELRPGYKHTLDVGSYGAAEIPWRYNNAAIGTEDMWYIGRDRTYVLTQR